MASLHRIVTVALSTLGAVGITACSGGGGSTSTGTSGSAGTAGSTTGIGGATGGSGGSTSSGVTSTGGSTGGTSTGSSTGGGGADAVSRGFYFAADAAANGWTITVVDPTAADPVVAKLSADELAALTGPAGNKKGPGWGDSISGPDGKRVFANASNADRVLVIETATPSIETVLKGGVKPLHIYNPNDIHEIWSHNDDEGSFTVIDTDTLAVSGPFAASLKGAGHGKLVYGKELGTKYFATNVNDPGGFALEGADHKATFVGLCAQACKDDPMTPEDESKNMCGGTHDKAYNPKTDQIVFQCSGDTAGKLAFVNAKTNAVVKDLVPAAVDGFAKTHDSKYILAFDNKGGAVNVWDTQAAGHDGQKFDGTAMIAGSASARGTDFRTNDKGQEEAWIPQSSGTKLVVLNLVTLEKEEIEIGVLSPPAGASSVTRRGEIAGEWYYTNNDAGLVMVHVVDKKIVTAAAPAGVIQRINGALVPVKP